jgi:DNA-binding CsgD family transcriptional regulator
MLDVDVDGARYLLVRLPRTNRPPVQLSPREQEIVRMVAQGHPNKVIADVLNISAWTVCTHLRRIFAKLNVGSRAAMIARTLETGVGRNPIIPLAFMTRASSPASKTSSDFLASSKKPAFDSRPELAAQKVRYDPLR